MCEHISEGEYQSAQRDGSDDSMASYYLDHAEDDRMATQRTRRRKSKRERKPVKWRTRDGAVIAIKDMSDAHLDNTIKMLVRNAPNHAVREQLCALRYAADAPDGAADAATSAANELQDMEFAARTGGEKERFALARAVYPKVFSALLGERARRIHDKRWSL